ncbi:10099_t:CDS:2 [Racocetra fulgida]|uniref:10099_t:CDS:1 n=1 Tax=Racocetra fulgida TaxID=60492 RepID=A0A9N8ZG25_9GLOM|nr:10099_t:CDS:2 [Racocetra fulgida]
MLPQRSYNNKSQRSYNSRPQRSYNNRPQRPFKFQRSPTNKFQRPYSQRSPEYNTYNNSSDFYRSGTNFKGNHWSHRGTFKGRGGNYHHHHPNFDGHSYYHQSQNGSAHYENKYGYKKYTPPSRNPSKSHFL